ncbi:peptidase C14, caspase catalytic subunit p20 [Epibacterium sp. SM1979]|uniref:Peptidase C14, caspase catalytic subunit p20 n=1 Tax=Tritonibacter litoralis TaxID=2662264 RepID=A0A843YGW1_9RHOB|nr:caspase family protein [Tritonibacter litoralis]MQQ10091.1 peptidase C14, caspase catalytic subunit p20 [Tritonibacter litoralis]
MVLRFWSVLLLVLSFALQAVSAVAEPRIALVVGNSAYGQVSPLDNPSHDARLMASTLERLGFDVRLLVDANQITMKRAIAQFGRDLRTAGEETTGLFYYAGHGVQSFGNNYLLPVDVALLDAADLDLVAVEAQSVLRQMASARNRTNIVILDACRNNPFETVAELDQNGLAEMKAPTGSFVAYATAPGEVAFDGEGSNSPFTAALVRQMDVPGLQIEQAFKNVRRDVLSQSQGLQTPWDTSSLVSDFSFRSGNTTPAPFEPVVASVPKVSALPEAVAALPSAETAMFRAAESANTIEALEEYLRVYPMGEHLNAARIALAALQSQAPAATAVPIAGLASVTFTAPITRDLPELGGRSMAELITSTPNYAPIEGLPEEVWKGQTCANCHEWNRERLCEQGQRYQVTASARSLHKPHPFGGQFKTVLRAWADNSCP